MSAYHHGETSLCMTIVNLAQNYVGSNNINLLEPRGQFGTRLQGGKDSASPRYIYTKMSPLTRLIFHVHDDPLLRYETDDNQKIEPMWYIPILPMVLVNGAEGIGTGWRTKIPNFNPRDIIANLRRILNDDEPKVMKPWYKNFKGTIEYNDEQRYLISGEIGINDNGEIEISELPIGTWTQVYKENVLENLLHGSERVKATIADYKEYSTDTTVKFVVTPLPGELTNMETEGLHNILKLQTSLPLSCMILFDEFGRIKKYEDVGTILKEFYTVRMRMYVNRKNYLEECLEAQASHLTFQAKFIVEKCSGKLVVENKRHKALVDELVKHGYPADPVKEWKAKVAREMNDDADADIQGEEEEEQPVDKKKGGSKDPDKEFKALTDVKKYDYLLGMPIWMLTNERKNQLLKQRDDKMTEMNILKEKTPADLWREDLDAFMIKLDEIEEKERRDKLEANKNNNSAQTKGGRKQKAVVYSDSSSQTARRIEPKLQEVKKVVKPRGPRKDKNAILNLSSQDEKDEFDVMLEENNKTLKEKLCYTENATGTKKRAPRKKKKTKLNFAKKSPKGKKKKLSSSEDEEEDKDKQKIDIDSDSDDFIPRERIARRAATTKKVNYKIIDDSDDDESNSEPELFDNDLVKEKDKQQVIMTVSDSNDDFPQPPVSRKSSDELFDSLFENSATLDDSNIPIGQKMSAEKRKRAANNNTNSKKAKPDK